MIHLIALAGLALLGGAGCTPLFHRETFPTDPSPSDALAHNPCSVKREPEIVVMDSGAPVNIVNGAMVTDWKRSEMGNEAVLRSLRTDLRQIKRINPIFLCGLERLELYGEKDYETKFRKMLTAIEGPHQFGLLRGHYDPEDRVIRLETWGFTRRGVFHELGHHVHNLGFYSKKAQDLISIGWNPSPKTESEIRKGKGDRFFVSDYAETDPIEDFAETFTEAFADPLVAGLKYLLPNSPHADTPATKKIQQMNQLAPASVQIVEVPASIGEVIQLPASDFTLYEGSSLYLFQKVGDRLGTYGQTMARRFDLSERQLTELEETNVNDFSKIVFGIKRGPFLVMIGWETYFSFEQTYHSVLGPELISIHRESGEGISKFSEDHPGKKVIGELIPHGDMVGFFVRNQNDHSLDFKEFDPVQGKASPLKSWQMPLDFTPLHVIPLNGADDFIIIGSNDSYAIPTGASSTDPSRTIFRFSYRSVGIQSIQMLRITRRTKGSSDFSIRTGERTGVSRDLVKSLGIPFREGNRIIFPTENFQFFYYDLVKDRFVLMNPKFDKNASRFKTIRSFFHHEGQTYAVGPGKEGGTLLAPIRFQWK